MNFFIKIIVMLYVVLMTFLACFCLLYIINVVKLVHIYNFLFSIQINYELKMVLAICSGILLLLNFTFYKTFSTDTRRNRMIVFDNPSGRVTVSLNAIEDLVNRTVVRLPMIKDVSSTIKTKKKGILIKVKLILCSEMNIQEITSEVQDAVVRKIQETIGIEENIDVVINIGKIIPEKIKDRHRKDMKKEEINVPFQGYRA